MSSVLIVEDNDPVAEIFVAALGNAGHDVDHSITGAGALHRIVRRHYDIVVMDVALPGDDGAKVAAQLRERGYDGPILAVTGGLIATDPEALQKAGFAAVLRKPVLPDELVAAVMLWCREEAT